MKIAIYFIIVLTILFQYQIFSQVSDKWEFRPDSVKNPLILYQVNSHKVDFDSIQSERNIYYAYDDNKNIITAWYKSLIGQDLINTIRYAYKYDENQLLITQTFQEWDEDRWVNLRRNSYIYDSNNLVIEELEENWSPVSQLWGNDEFIKYNYDSQNKLMDELTQLWYTDKWHNYQLRTFTYDYNDNLILELVQVGGGESWFNNERYIKSYVNGLLVENIFQFWHSNENYWYNVVRDSMIYNADGYIIKSVEQEWQEWNEDWENTILIENIYNSRNKLIEQKYSRWSLSNLWQQYVQTTFSSDMYGNVLGRFSHHYTANYDSKGTDTYYYILKDDYSNDPNNFLEFNLSQNYPNPFNSITNINYKFRLANQELSTNVNVKVYDVLGSHITTLVSDMQQSGSYSLPINFNYLSSGIYFYRLQAGNFVETKKMVLLK